MADASSAGGLCDLPLPELESSETWDSTYADAVTNRSSICAHAVAHGCLVGGCHNAEWLAWKTSLSPHQVTQVVSNADGSVIAAATDGGTVSLLRGSDGEKLATRKVSCEGQSARISFVGGGSHYGDAILIEASSSDEQTNLILVSNIHGNKLQDEQPEKVAEAVRRTKIQAVKLEASKDLLSFSGHFQDSDTIRLVACDSKGTLSVYGYTISQKQTVLMKSGLSLMETSKEDWSIDYEMGFRVHNFSQRSYSVCSACSEGVAAAFWFDPATLETVCRFQLPKPSSQTQRPKLMAMEAVQSFSDKVALAMALLVKSRSDSGTTTSSVAYVIQIAVEETMGLAVLSEPLIVYTIPIDTPTCSAALAPLNERSPYSFRLKLWQGSDQFACKAFVSESPTVGQVRFLIQRGDFDRADIIMAEKGERGVDALINNPFASFHPSEVALKRMQRLVEQGNVCDPVAIEQAQACLHRLASGALSRNERGLQLLLDAPRTVIESYPNPSIADLTKALSAVASTLENVAEALPPAQKVLVEAKKNELQDRVAALTFVDGVQDRLKLQTPTIAVQSPAHLFAILVVEHQFALAEMLWKSDLKTSSNSDFLVSAMVKVTAEVAPKEYLRLLEDVVLPSLTINHELLPSLRAWCCRTADALDDESEDGLESAIQLLEAVDNGTKRLQVKIHSSFATYTPFVERLEGRKVKRSPRNNNSSHDSVEKSVLFSSSSKTSTRNKQATGSGNLSDGRRPIPTVLELSHLKGGASKFRAGFAFRAEQTSEENEECLQDKLRQAECLQQARFLGMDAKTTTLRTFEQKGGALFCAVELASLFSKNAESHDDRLESFSGKLQPFCQQFAVSYDRSLIECSLHLCRGKDVTESDIQESSSIARCCPTEATKCQVTLAVLRAALFCGLSATWLSKLSKDAVTWASSDSCLKSELEEASRLLLIHSIVIKYCGSGARELFRVENPRHAIRLLEFVAQHVEKDSVLEDTLSLCDAFTHLLPADACRLIFHKAVLVDDFLPCAYLTRQLFKRDKVLAENTLVSVISYVDEILAECSKEIHSSTTETRPLKVYKRRAMTVCSNVSALIMVALEKIRTLPVSVLAEIDCYVSGGSLEKLRDAFNGIHELRSHHNIYISLSDLCSTEKIIRMTSILLLPIVDAQASEDIPLLRTRVQRAKRGCSLMVGSSVGDFHDVWTASCAFVVNSLIHQHHDDRIISFIHALDLFQGSNDDLAARACLSTAMALCSRASNHPTTSSPLDGMKLIARATSLLRDEALQITSSQLLPSVVSMACLLDGVSQLFTRADEGKGEVLDSFRESLQTGVWGRTLLSGDTGQEEEHSALDVNHPSLHQSWYVGDGLLLPPEDVLPLSHHFCQEMLGMGRGLNSGTLELYRFVADRGAHFLSLRVLISSTIAMTSRPRSVASLQTQVICDDLNIELANLMNSLVERSLGGTGSGIMNGIIDSHLATAFLLLLPMKLAFKLYKSALPVGIKSGAFDRVFALAHVGQVASEGGNLEKGGFCGVGWKRQQKFASQCKHLASRATWWKILQDYKVSFDPQLFNVSAAMTSTTEKLPQEESTKAESKYAESLLTPFIASMSRTVETEVLLDLGSMFATAFGFPADTVLQKHIEFLLAPPSINETNDAVSGSSKIHRDIRLDLDQCQRKARSSLHLLNSPIKRCAVLRRCLIALEGSPNCGWDYERHGVLLSLYHDALLHVLEQDLSLQNQESASFEAELDLVDRRRDALAILLSFFQGERAWDRPEFPSFFEPLPEPFGTASPITKHTACSVLGNWTMKDEVRFDPLLPLQKFLSASPDTASTAALAPLCLPLGLPQGYVHARSLIERFQSPIRQSNALSFDNDVVPVISRLKSSSDRVLLAQWCSTHYVDNDEEKLKCLDLALCSAMQASTEVEKRHRHHSHGKDQILEEQEMRALENLKRITLARDALSDKLKVKTILASADSSAQGTVRRIAEKLIAKLEVLFAGNPDLCPENLLNFLLSEGSLLVAQASLDPSLALSMKLFRSFLTIVREACTVISEQHSHIRPAQYAKRFARQWLFHGDGATHVDENQGNAKVTTPMLDVEEDNTVDFVMDLADLQEDDWGGSAEKKSDARLRFTLEEEPTALKASSAREQSENGTQQAALRIAFVLAFEDSNDLESVTCEVDDENTGLTANKDKATSEKKRGHLLSRVETKRDSKKHNQVVQLSRQLLQIVFAKPGYSPKLFSQASFDNDNADTSICQGGSGVPKTITFAMRHRALRAASILCPQEALDQVLRDEGFLCSGLSQGWQESSLEKCTFGAFVAKEIEEMGLPLPHSDLCQLSSMHFLSYARTLWRHYGNGDVQGSKGRLLLLLVEMSLKEKTSDYAFVASLLSQLNQLQLPRTLLLAIECLVAYQSRVESSSALDCVTVQACLSTLTKAACSELNTISVSYLEDEESVKDILETSERLGDVLVALCEHEGKQTAIQFAENLCTVANDSLPQSLLKKLADLSISVVGRLGSDLTSMLVPSFSLNEPATGSHSNGTIDGGESIEVDKYGIPLTASYSEKVQKVSCHSRTIMSCQNLADTEGPNSVLEQAVEGSESSMMTELGNASCSESIENVSLDHNTSADSKVLASSATMPGVTASHIIFNEESSGQEEVELSYHQSQEMVSEAAPDAAEAGSHNERQSNFCSWEAGEMNGRRIYRPASHSLGQTASNSSATEESGRSLMDASSEFRSEAETSETFERAAIASVYPVNEAEASIIESNGETKALGKIRTVSCSKDCAVGDLGNRTAVTEGSGSYSIEESNTNGDEINVMLLGKSTTAGSEQNKADAFEVEEPAEEMKRMKGNADGVVMFELPLSATSVNCTKGEAISLEERDRRTKSQGPRIDSNDEHVTDVAEELGILKECVAQDLAVDGSVREEHTILFEAFSKEERLFVEERVDE